MTKTNLNTRILQLLNLFSFQMNVLLLQLFSNRVYNISLETSGKPKELKMIKLKHI